MLHQRTLVLFPAPSLDTKFQLVVLIPQETCMNVESCQHMLHVSACCMGTHTHAHTVKNKNKKALVAGL